MAEKTRLTYAYVQLSYRFYRDARKKLLSVYQEFQMSNLHRVVFFGVGELAEIAYISFQESELEFVAISDFECVGEQFFGHQIICIEELRDIRYDALLLTRNGGEYNLEEQLVQKGVKMSKIRSL